MDLKEQACKPLQAEGHSGFAEQVAVLKISAASSVGWCLTITSFFHPF